MSSLLALQQFVPTADDIQKVNTFITKKIQARAEAGQDNSAAASTNAAGTIHDSKMLTSLSIGKAEQYIYYLSKLSQLDKRLTAMTSVLSAAEVVPNMLKQSEWLLNSVAEVKGSGKLKFVLRTFLDLNNALAVQAKLR
jgi:hypothetical protein